MGRKKGREIAAARKQMHARPPTPDVQLAPELLAEWGGGSDSGPLVLSGAKKAAQAQASGAPPGPKQPPLTKQQRKKLAKIEEVKRARDVRAGVLASLSEHALSAAQQALLRPTSRLGQRETLREGLSRALKHERMGLPLPSGVPLLRDRREVGPDELPDAEDAAAAAADSDGDDAPETRAAAAPAADPFAGGALAALAARAMGTKARKPDRKSLKRHKLEAAEEEDAAAAGDAPARSLAAAGPAAAALRPLARALRADVTGEAEGVADDPHAAERAARRAALQARPPDAARKRVVMPPRPDDVAAARLKLPILAMEQEIMEAITEHPVVVLCGETGCGKTTQVPQFLYEAGYGTGAGPQAGAVCVTQPRRVAVTSTAARVAAELGEARLGGAVGYAVRHDTSTAAKSALRFVTDGVLLREAQSDLLLSRYSVVVIDEAHERSVNTDLLIGLLSRIVPLRARLAADPASGVAPLRLVVMSATLRVDDFAANARLCAVPPPVLRVPARQFPVTVHFARRTAGADYVGAAFKKVAAIHNKLPPGGVLVFLTGQREVEHLAERLRTAFNVKKKGKGRPGADKALAAEEMDRDDDDDIDGPSALDALGADAFDRDALDAAAEAEEAALEGAFAAEGAEGEGDEDDDSQSDEEETMQLGGDAPEEDAAAAAAADAAAAEAHAAARAAAGDADKGPGPLHVLPLYALLPPRAQARVFAPPPPGHRLVVVATNVAETSLTIPGIRYVVDAGRAKARVYAPGAAGGGLSRFEVGWVSQASAAQRAGRAGRTGPGHAYRLYSSAHYVNDMPEHAPPELLCVPLDGVVLQMKAIGIDKVAGFPFPSPPDASALLEAERALQRLGALDVGGVGALTALGRGMALLPVAPRAARMLLAAAAEPRAAALLPHAAAIAAALSLESPFIKRGGESNAAAAAQEGDDAEADAAAAAAALASPEAPPATAAEAERLAWERRGKGRHAAYGHARSDALSAVAALLAYEAAASGPGGAAAADALCARDALHARTLREMADLRSQLARLLARHAPALCAAAAEAAAAAGADAASSSSRRPAAPADPDAVAAALQAGPPGTDSLGGGAERALRRAIAAGWADRVARRVKPAEQLTGAPSRAVRYRAAFCGAADDATGSAQFVFLHPSSALHAAAPEWVVYTELLQTGARPYMLGATAVEAEWLASAAPRLCAVSAPLAEPAPCYVPGADAVVAWHAATYGPHAWALPNLARPLPTAGPHADAAFAVFAAALLDGRVVDGFAPLRERLAAPPATAARPEARSQRRVGELLHALRRRAVASRAALAAAWRAEPRYLLPELAQWMRAGQQHVLERAWPVIVACTPAATLDAADGEPDAATAARRKKKRKAAAEDAA